MRWGEAELWWAVTSREVRWCVVIVIISGKRSHPFCLESREDPGILIALRNVTGLMFEFPFIKQPDEGCVAISNWQMLFFFFLITVMLHFLVHDVRRGRCLPLYKTVFVWAERESVFIVQHYNAHCPTKWVMYELLHTSNASVGACSSTESLGCISWTIGFLTDIP